MTGHEERAIAVGCGALVPKEEICRTLRDADATTRNYSFMGRLFCGRRRRRYISEEEEEEEEEEEVGGGGGVASVVPLLQNVSLVFGTGF